VGKGERKRLSPATSDLRYVFHFCFCFRFWFSFCLIFTNTRSFFLIHVLSNHPAPFLSFHLSSDWTWTSSWTLTLQRWVGGLLFFVDFLSFFWMRTLLTFSLSFFFRNGLELWPGFWHCKVSGWVDFFRGFPFFFFWLGTLLTSPLFLFF
jgi:hypothetical protein